MPAPLTSDGKFNFGNCAGSKHTERENPFPHKWEAEEDHALHREAGKAAFVFSEHWFHNPQSRESKKKIEIHPPTMGEKPGGLQEGCGEKLSRSVALFCVQ